MIEELLERLKLKEYYDLSKKENDDSIIINHVLKVFNELSTIEKISLIDIFYAYGRYSIIDTITNESDNIKYLLLYYLLSGRDLEKLKDPKAFDLETTFELVGGAKVNSVMSKKYLFGKVSKFLVNNNIDNGLDALFSEFALDFTDNYKLFTLGDDSLNLFDIVTELFNPKNNIDFNTLEKIYDEVLYVDPMFASFDYTDLFTKNIESLTHIKGLVNEVPQDFLYYLVSDEEFSEEEQIELADTIEQIYLVNKDDEETLCYFFFLLECIRNCDNINNKLFEILLSKDYYQKYSNEEAFDRKIVDMNNEVLEGKYKFHNKKLVEVLGESDTFISMDALKLFMESDDEDYKRQLIIPIIVKDINKMREQYGVDFELSFETDSHVDGLCGYYSSDLNKLFVNRSLIYSIKDPLEALIQCEDTFYHEIRHARQEKELRENKDFTYTNILMAMELLINETSLTYYKTNYRNISYEQDARAEAYVYTMSYFKDYPSVQDKVRSMFDEKIDNMTNFIKKKNMPLYDEPFYVSILNQFVETFNITLDNKEFLEYHIGCFNRYPVLSMVFDIDMKTANIKLKSKEDLEHLKGSYLSQPDSKEKEEGLKCLELLDYQIKVSEFFKKNANWNSYIKLDEEDSPFKSYDDIKSKVEEELGEAPKR